MKRLITVLCILVSTASRSSCLAVNKSQNFEISIRIPSLCRTVHDDLCHFPFRYKGVEYTECTYTDSPTAWCATRVDPSGNVIQNRWGDCAIQSSTSSCPVDTPGTGDRFTTPQPTRIPATSCFTVGGPDPNRRCLFPFIHDGKLFNECTTYGLGDYWCSTLTLPNNTHVQGQGYYGLCSRSCPGLTEPTTRPTTTSTTRRPVQPSRTTTSRPPASCKNGDTWRRDCNMCLCDNGTEFCTEKSCIEGCVPGDTWQKDCNTCICTSDGNTVCTEKFCTKSCIPESGPGAGEPCIFPFTWNKVTYTACAPWIWTGENFGKTWCSTKVDRFGNHVDGEGKYGFCSKTCSNRDSTRVDYFPVSLENGGIRDSILGSLVYFRLPGTR